jgi:endonuclease/exonuclease/phosphatase (EEP) superfamily protein YafD
VRTGENDYEYRGAPPPELLAVAEPPGRPPVPVRRPRGRSGSARCAALLLGPVSVPLVARALDADGPAPLPQLLAFLPWFLVPAWLALVLAVFARRALLAVWALAVLAATGVFVQPYGPDAGPERRSDPVARFRVLTANLEFGNATGGLVDLLLRERPQVVAVQECDTRCAAALRGPALREAYPHRVVVTGGPAEGSALLSVFPLRSEPVLDSALAMPGAVLDVADVPVRVRVVHPMPPLFRSMGQWYGELGTLREDARRHRDGPLVMAGDFNASQDHAVFREILDTGLRDAARLEGRSRTPTWPAPLAPPLGAQIDHVLVSSHFQAADARFFDLPDTDHRALLADVELFAGP